MKMKKISIILVTLLFAFTFSNCVNRNTVDSTPQPVSVSKQPGNSETMKPEDPADTGSNTDGSSQENTEKPVPEKIESPDPSGNNSEKAFSVSEYRKNNGTHFFESQISSLVLNNEGLYQWGYICDDIHYTKPQKVIFPTGIKDVVLSSSNGPSGPNSNKFAIDENDQVWAWGDNGSKRLGIEGIDKTDTPMKVEKLDNVAKVSCSFLYYSIALKYDGSVWIWGLDKTPTKLEGLSNIVDIIALPYFYAALDQSGNIYTWKCEEWVLSKIEKLSLTGIKKICTDSRSFFLAEDDQGSSWFWRGNWTPRKLEINNVVDLFVHNDRTFYALRDDGTVWAWGENDKFQFTDEYERGLYEQPVQLHYLKDVVKVLYSLGIIALDRNGDLWNWGNSSYPYFPYDNSILKKPEKFVWVNNVVEIYEEAAIDRTGDLYMWGNNYYGKLGTGNLINSSRPKRIFFNIFETYAEDNIYLYLGRETVNGMYERLNEYPELDNISFTLKKPENSRYSQYYRDEKSLHVTADLVGEINSLKISDYIEIFYDAYIDHRNYFYESDVRQLIFELTPQTGGEIRLVLDDLINTLGNNHFNSIRTQSRVYIKDVDFETGTVFNYWPDPDWSLISRESAAKMLADYVGLNKDIVYNLYCHEEAMHFYDFSCSSDQEEPIDFRVNAENGLVYRYYPMEDVYVKAGPTVNDTGTEKPEVLDVHNFKELISSLGPNRIIQIHPGEYDMASFDHICFSDMRYINNYCYKYQYGTLIIGLENVTFRGIPDEGNNLVDMITPNMSCTVLSFRQCHGITLENLNIGHDPYSTSCTGDVVQIDYCEGVVFNNCTLFGCGLTGLVCNNSKDISFSESRITNCSYNIMRLQNTMNAHFKNSSFTGNRGGILTHVCDNITFDNCEGHEGYE